APKGTPGVAERYLAAVHHTSLKQVQNVLSRQRSQLRKTGKPALAISTETPLEVPIRGQLHGRRWKTHINFHDAPMLMRRLSTADEPWTPENKRNTIRAGEAMSTAGASYRIREFNTWVNAFVTEQDLHGERIPDDPDGHITIGRLRRTVAWHIARLPGGRIAL